MKANVQFLLRKSDDDDALVAMLQKQLGREDSAPHAVDRLRAYLFYTFSIL